MQQRWKGRRTGAEKEEEADSRNRGKKQGGKIEEQREKP